MATIVTPKISQNAVEQIQLVQSPASRKCLPDSSRTVKWWQLIRAFRSVQLPSPTNIVLYEFFTQKNTVHIFKRTLTELARPMGKQRLQLKGALHILA